MTYYWTAFTFEGYGPNELHCTHKFLGELKDDQPEYVRQEIELYFQEPMELRPYRLEFNRSAMFGQKQDVHVLKADMLTESILERHFRLRAALDKYRDDDFGMYQPHVTTEKKAFSGRISGYVLMAGKNEVQRWPAAQVLTNAKPNLGNGDRVLPPIKEHVSEFAQLEKEILDAFRAVVFRPLLKVLHVDDRLLANSRARMGLKRAIQTGRITYSRGKFTGAFSAEISKELKQLGAEWDRKGQAWRVSTSVLPQEIRTAITTSEAAWGKTLEGIDDQIRKILPEEIAGKVDSQPLFDSSLWKIDRKVDNTLESIAVLPKLSPERRSKIAAEWRDNLDLWITDFAAEEIPKLRDEIQKHVMSGGRYEDVIASLQRSYGITQRKARFLARQETGLLMAKFKETRYSEAGVDEYRWGCVAGSAKHPVRPSHKILEGKIFRWDDPPITTAPDQPARRNNPGEDFNCRCFARPVVRGLKGKYV